MPKVAEHEKSKTQIQDARQRIRAALRRDDFNIYYSAFKNTWQARGCPDEMMVCTNPGYYDLYLHLKRMCNDYSLIWPLDGMYLLRLAIVDGNGDAIVPDDCPPRKYWQWFRMARSGLGLPRDQEVETAQQVSNNSKRARNTSQGFVYAEIAQRENVTERTVQKAIKQCWEYLARGGDLQRIADLAGLRKSDDILPSDEMVDLMIVRDRLWLKRGIPEK